MLTISQVFNECRTCYKFSDKPVEDAKLQEIYELMKFGPTSANSSPMRIIFVKSGAERLKLLDCVLEGNKEKTKSAPVVAILAYDSKFYEYMPQLFPHNPSFGNMFAGNEGLSFDTAFRNSSMQAGYFLIVARALGLDTGPMSGFDANKLNETFFTGSSFKVNLLCNLGYKDTSADILPRLPRLSFEQGCKII